MTNTRLLASAALLAASLALDPGAAAQTPAATKPAAPSASAAAKAAPQLDARAMDLLKGISLYSKRAVAPEKRVAKSEKVAAK